MGAENNKNQSQSSKGMDRGRIQELMKLLDIKESRLAKGLRKHIRELKASGQIEQALSLRQKKMKDFAKAQAARTLDEVLVGILVAPNPLEEAVKQVEAIWLLDKLGFLESADERTSNLKELLEHQDPQVAKELSARMGAIRDKYSLPKRPISL